MAIELEKHHKLIIGGAGTLLVLFMVLSSVFMYLLFIKQSADYKDLSGKLDSLQTDTAARLNEISTNLLDTRNELQSLGLQLGSIDNEVSSLKASVSSDFSSIVENAIKSVVTIKTDLSQGSGFFVADGGYVVTNAHVMRGATAAAIITYDGTSHKVTKIGENTFMDIVLLKIASTSYKPLTLEDSDDVKQAEKVIAIGNPQGLDFSVTEGIVSATHRQGGNGLEAYIQTTAALNPGNSGGPLINVNGKAIGINNFKISEGESLGFALESNYIKATVNEIYSDAQGANLI